MHVVLDIGIAIFILFLVSFGGVGAFIAYVNHNRKQGAHEIPEKKEEEHMAWVVGLRDDTDLFFTGSKTSHP